MIKPKHLFPYGAHSLKVIMEGEKCNVAWMSTKHIAVIRPHGIGEYKKIKWKYAHLNIKPVLKPLSELAVFIDKMLHDEQWHDEWISHFKDFQDKPHEANILACPYDLMEYLMIEKFDIFHLIPKGLAVDINTLK